MKKEKLDERYTAVFKIQQQMSRLSPGDYNYEVLDKAYELALNPGRKIDSYFLRNLIRDARHTLKRQKNTLPIISYFQDDLTEDGEEFLDDIYPSEDFFLNGYVAEEDLVIFQELCGSIHPKAQDILLDHIAGYRTSDISAKYNLHESQVKKIRVSIKQKISGYLYN
ncbi:hypothetical protein ACEN2P_08150 [Pedobacter psychrotolerans]|uniref:hypothetical protein n=1 Tax=Pedobacter psychrotolerans TaxID=1843235 RepID=UPI003F9A9E47